MPFAALGLAPALAHAARQRGYHQPTPVQAAAIPALLGGRDLQMQAHTGSGKTAAFALPLLQQWLSGAPRAPRPLRGLVLVPTRELALQVGQTLRELAHDLPDLAKVAVAFGGVSINPQMMALRGGADLMVATPGRLLDLVRHNAVRLDQVNCLVLDEADRLLSLGFADELAEVLALLPQRPQRHQTVLCSATFPAPVKALAAALLHEPERIDLVGLAGAAAARADIRQRAITVDADRRLVLLRQLIKAAGNDRALVFVATKYATELVADKLGRVGIAAAPFHGELSQGARSDTLAAFQRGPLQVMVATDMAARGLHIEALPLVVNYDLPRAAEDYVHRIGRTGRAGGVGAAISFIIPSAEAHFRLIEKRQGLRVPREVLPGFEPEVGGAASASKGPGTGLDPNGGIKGKRKSKKDKLREAALLTAKPPRGG
jgi:superfamily II DNA/RNA helicase